MSVVLESLPPIGLAKVLPIGLGFRPKVSLQFQYQNNSVQSGARAAAQADPKVAVTAYIAYVVRYVRGWLRSSRRELFRRRKPIWFLNLGMPAASYDDIERAELYRRIGSAGLLLSDFEAPASVKAANKFLEDRHVVDAGASKEAAEATRSQRGKSRFGDSAAFHSRAS